MRLMEPSNISHRHLVGMHLLAPSNQEPMNLLSTSSLSPLSCRIQLLELSKEWPYHTAYASELMQPEVHLFVLAGAEGAPLRLELSVGHPAL